MMAMWPVVLLAVVSGLAFELVKWVILGARRHIYNRNRNRKYAEGKLHDRDSQCAEGKGIKERRERKNMLWRTGGPRDWRRAPLPAPEGFAEELCRQWDKVHDSMEEMIRFGEMMVELEDYVDNSYIFDGDDIVGRHPGMKGFLESKCPHIGYSTAIRYRIFAMKAKEVVLRQGDAVKVGAQCRTVCELGEALDARLGVVRRRLERPRRQCSRLRKDRSPQPVIFSIRDAVRSAGRLDVLRRRRVADALREILRELAVS